MKLPKINILNLKLKSNIIPIFFACDDNYVKYMMVTMRSIIANSSERNTYKMYVLHTNISSANQQKVKMMEKENVIITFCNVSAELAKIEKKLSIRDYYSCTTYYRVFIADMFPQYDKVLYIDSDTIVLRDIAELYSYQLGDNYIGGIQDYLVVHVDDFGNYVEKVLGVSRAAYFNAGVVLINAEAFRKNKMQKKFVDLLNLYSFVVAQDQDYLNVLCQNKVLWIDSKWNVQMPEPEMRDLSKVCLIHYNLAEKPWHYKNGKYSEQFWQYAEETCDCEMLKRELENFSEKDIEIDRLSGENLLQLALKEINKEDNYLNRFGSVMKPSLSRKEVLAKIEQYEREGRFDEDVEEDPPSRMIMPDEVDYLRKSPESRLRSVYAFNIARWFMNIMMYKKQLIIKEVVGIENIRKLKSGAIITCNHFNAFDSFAMQVPYAKSRQRGRKLFRIIKEGNYTSFPGFYGFLMRNCNTLPLSSNKDTMKKMIKAVDTLLQKGHFILIYPEQSMWWNYRKPKPLKKGGFTFAARNKVPVLPCFITMKDSDVMDADGYPVQEYTIHVAEPIYPDKNKSKAENAEEMMQKNYEVWKEIYERVYGIPLVYSCDRNKETEEEENI